MHPFSPRLNHGHLEVTVLDIGQGDSIFVAFPDGHTMLVDGGGLPGSTFVRGMRNPASMSAKTWFRPICGAAV